MPKGVYHYPDRTKPFRIQPVVNGRQICKYFATEREVIVALTAHRAIQNVIAKVRREDRKRRPLSEKRAADLAIYGGNLALERDFAVALVAEWRRQTGREALVLNDGTRGDVLLEIAPGAFLCVQLKTTGKAMRNNMWLFADVLGYADMPVVCWREDHRDAWVFDGAVLEERGKRGLGITPNCKNCHLAMARGLGIPALVRFLDERSSDWPSVTEDAARCNFQSATHDKEMRGINVYRARFPDVDFRWPDGQNTHVDLWEGSVRLQFKTIREKAKKTGFYCSTSTSNGHDHDGRQLTTPYPSDAFDVLIAVWEVPGGEFHFWRFPADELVRRGVLATEYQTGKTGFYVYGPEGVGKQPTLNADTWSREFYVSDISAK